MAFFETMQEPFSQFPYVQEAVDYVVDAGQRSVIFMDILRKRGNIYLDHLEKGQPPVLVFDYEILMDGRTFERPANYALAMIRDRRHADKAVKNGDDKREPATARAPEKVSNKRPIVIIDPRAGHGPGIGGSKLNSEIGMALSNSHPVYFIFFYTDPMPDQTLADVKNAEVKFLEEVIRRHPGAPKPAVIGNCQGGWGAALLAADRPDLVGPLMLNGAPLSYWSGVEGKNPMRYKGGLLGGVWMNSFLSDLGNGHFDGANLVMNMELLNPANTFWTKQYNVFSKAEKEEERFLDFEKWWGGFYMMTDEEIHQIVDGLFVGNKLVQGTFELEKGKPVDLKHFNDPVVVFASEGDNITPPQQALFWIPQVYGSVDEIKRHEQTIVYMVHPKIGHLGIFVSSSIAQKEQKEMIGSVEMINYLSPGLYEMVIEQEPSREWMNDYKVRFEEREIEDILKLGDRIEDERDFYHVAKVSEMNDQLYRTFMSPLVKSVASDMSAEVLKQTHPLRVQRYAFSDLNPFMSPYKMMAETVKEERSPVSEDNIFLEMEKTLSSAIEGSLNYYRDVRDMTQEAVFKSIYSSPFWQMFPFGNGSVEERRAERARELKKKSQADRRKWLGAMEKGGYREGVVRTILAMASVDKNIDEAEYKKAGEILRSRVRFKDVSPLEVQNMVKEQSRILQIDREKALESLKVLLPTRDDRDKALAFAEEVAMADGEYDKKEKALFTKLKKILK